LDFGGEKAGGGRIDAVEDRRDRQTQYVALSRACVDLYEEMVALFANWPGIEVVVDRGSRPSFARGVPESG
jgi:hypothetical protein